MAISQKIGVAAIFLLGLITIVITAIRIWVQLSTPYTDFTYHSTSIYIWTAVEWSVAIMVTCGAGLRPLLERATALKPVSWLLSSWRSRSTHSSNKTTISDGKGAHRFHQIDEIELALNPMSTVRGRGRGIGHTEVEVEVGADANRDGEQASVDGNHKTNPPGINVESGWSVLSEAVEAPQKAAKV
ncbi:MAG: hypothetical protein Q9160_000001 [Pyrenula sp. 1 TL-2023]